MNRFPRKSKRTCSAKQDAGPVGTIPQWMRTTITTSIVRRNHEGAPGERGDQPHG